MQTIELCLGDCFDYLPQIPSGSVDMILADLPYGTTRCSWDVLLPFEDLWREYNRVIKENGAVILFGTEPFSSALRLSNIKDYRYDICWQKDRAANFLFGNRMPLKVIETISVFYKKQPTYNPQKRENPKGPSKRHLSRYVKPSDNVKDVMGDSWKLQSWEAGQKYEPDKLLPTSIEYCAREQRGKVHPTQKPVALLERLILTYTNEGETVLDNCMGSGSTGVAALKTKRSFIGMEKEEKYYMIAQDRINGVTPT
jgi:DNA modification methylase